MNEEEQKILKLLEEFKKKLETQLLEESTPNKKISITDIKYIGETSWKDKINGNDVSEQLFLVEKEIAQLTEKGEETKKVINYYLGDKCIAGEFNKQIIYSENFKNAEPHKLEAINKLVEKTNGIDLENSSLNSLQNKELSMVLSAHLGRNVTPEEVETEIENLNENDLKELNQESKEVDKEENNLSEKQTEKIKVNGVQKINLDTKVDGIETLGSRLDLHGFESICVVYSDKVNDISANEQRNNTTYSLVGIRPDGTAKVLNDEFEIDRSVGNSPSASQSKIRADGTATRDNHDLSVYTRKSNGASFGCENEFGNVNCFLYQKTIEENENIGIQIETSQTQYIPIESREIMNRNKGIYQHDKVQNEIEMHTQYEASVENTKDYDGNVTTQTHIHHDKASIDACVQDLLQNPEISEVFTEREIREKLERELDEDSQLEEIKNKVKDEMEADAQFYSRDRNR